MLLSLTKQQIFQPLHCLANYRLYFFFLSATDIIITIATHLVCHLVFLFGLIGETAFKKPSFQSKSDEWNWQDCSSSKFILRLFDWLSRIFDTLSRWRLWRHFTQKSAATYELYVCPALMRQRPPVPDQDCIHTCLFIIVRRISSIPLQRCCQVGNDPNVFQCNKLFIICVRVSLYALL